MFLGGLFFDVGFLDIGISCIAWEQGEDGVDVWLYTVFRYCMSIHIHSTFYDTAYCNTNSGMVSHFLIPA